MSAAGYPDRAFPPLLLPTRRPSPHGNKHFICVVEHLSGAAFAAANFEENYVHMREAYNPEDFFKNVQPVILFDNDSDEAEGSLTCGWIFRGAAADNCWSGTANAGGTVALVNAYNTQKQYQRATDYRGVNAVIGASGLDVTGIDLTPTTAANRFRVPTSVEVMQFRRPSSIRLFGHAFEWAGYANYTKAIPRYQGDLTAANKFTYYATNEGGGRVYFAASTRKASASAPAASKTFRPVSCWPLKQSAHPTAPSMSSPTSLRSAQQI